MAPFYWVCLTHLISSHVAYIGDPKIRTVVVKWLLFTVPLCYKWGKRNPKTVIAVDRLWPRTIPRRLFARIWLFILTMWWMSGNLNLIAFLAHVKNMLETSELNGGPLDFSSRHSCEKVTRMPMVESTQRTLSILN